MATHGRKLMPRLLILLLLLLSACASAPERVEPDATPVLEPAIPTQTKCIDCGVVQNIQKVTANSSEATTAKRPVLSGIVGGVASKPSTTKPASRYEIWIQMLNGRKVLVTQTVLSAGLRIGSKVRVSQGRILAVGP